MDTIIYKTKGTNSQFSMAVTFGLKYFVTNVTNTFFVSKSNTNMRTIHQVMHFNNSENNSAYSC